MKIRRSGRWVLVDTSALVGIFMRDDDWHGPAVEALEKLQASGRMMLTTNDVFGETLTALRRWAGHAQAVGVGDILRQSELVKLVSIDDTTREAAWKLFRKYDDQVLSFTDCTSFATMHRFQIQEAFTFDDDFRKVGYTVLP